MNHDHLLRSSLLQRLLFQNDRGSLLQRFLSLDGHGYPPEVFLTLSHVQDRQWPHRGVQNRQSCPQSVVCKQLLLRVICFDVGK